MGVTGATMELSTEIDPAGPIGSAYRMALNCMLPSSATAPPVKPHSTCTEPPAAADSIAVVLPEESNTFMSGPIPDRNELRSCHIVGLPFLVSRARGTMSCGQR